jgi:hypothetical protein
MLIKIMLLLRRKPGMTFEQFKAHYETTHVQLAHQYVGHLITKYTRNYAVNYEGESLEGQNPGFAASPYDCITEVHLRDQAAWTEFQRIAADPAVQKILGADEERFLDRPSLRIFQVSEVHSPPEALSGA